MTFGAFMFAAARAVRHMPCIRTFEIMLDKRPSVDAEFLGPGEKGAWYSQYCKNVRDFLDDHEAHGKWLIFMPEDEPAVTWDVAPEVNDALRLSTGRDDCLLVVRGSELCEV